MKDQDVDKLFRDALQKHEASPSADLWQKIERELEHEGEVLPMIPTKTRRFTWKPYAAAASLFILCGATFFVMRNTDISSVQHGTAHVERLPESKASEGTAADSDQQVSEDNVVPKNERQQLASKTIERTNRQDGITSNDTRKDELVTMEFTDREETIIAANSERLAPEAITARHEPLSDVQQVVIEPSNTQLAQLEVASPHTQPVYVEVTDVEPVKPLLERFDGEDDEMFAASEVRKVKGGILNGIKNLVNENVSAITGREVNIGADAEGSLRIDIGNGLARNRNKNRK